MVWFDVDGDAVVVAGKRLLIFLQQVGAPGCGEREAGREGDRAAPALAFVEPQDDASPVLGSFDCFDDYVGPVYGDKGHLRSGQGATARMCPYLPDDDRVVERVGGPDGALVPAAGVR